MGAEIEFGRKCVREALPGTTLGSDDDRSASALSCRVRAEDPLARELDDPQRQSRSGQQRRDEGRRASGVLGLPFHHHDGLVSGRFEARGQGRGEAPCEPDLPRHPISARPPDAGEAREFPRLQGRAILSLAHQGRRRCGFLHRFGRPRRGADAVCQPGAGLCEGA